MNGVRKILVALLLVGMAVSIYLTYVHYNVSALVCPTSGLVDCESVLTSQWATVLGIPIALAAVFWFALALAAVLRKWYLLGEFLGVVSLGAVAYSFITMSLIGKICAWCSGVDAILIVYIALVFVHSRKVWK